MNEDRVAGTATNLGGKVQQGIGRVTGDTKSQVEGVVNQAAAQPKTSMVRPRTPPPTPPKPSARVRWMLKTISAS